MLKIHLKKNINWERRSTDIKHLNDSETLIEYFNYMDDIYTNIKEYNLNKKRKMSIIFDDMIADMLNNQKVNQGVTELYIRGRKLNMFLGFIRQTYFALQKRKSKVSSTHILLWKIPKNRSFSKLHLIISKILTLKILWIFIANVLQSLILFLVIDGTHA